MAKKETLSPLHSTLIRAGLSSEEAEIYLDLLEHGAETATQVSAHTSVKRTYVYKLVQGLIQKGLVSELTEGKTTKFEPKSPDHLLGLVEAKKAEVNSAERELEASLKKLKDKFSSVEAKPIVQVYEGYEGIKKVYLDTIKEGKTIDAFLQNLDINPEFRTWLREKYLSLRKQNNVKANVIIASSEEADRYVKESPEALRSVLVVPQSKYPFQVEVDIYGDKIAFMNFKNSDNPIGLIIENKDIADTFRAFFKLTWDNTRKTV